MKNKAPSYCVCGCGGLLPRTKGKSSGRYDWALPGHRGKAIQQLTAGDRIPPWPPRKFQNQRGYIRLRWQMPDGTHIEVYEHRVKDGVVIAGVMHHKNHDKTDNSPQNLEELDRVQHLKMHGIERRHFSTEHAKALYQSGLGIVQVGKALGVHHVTVMRRLKANGVTMRGRRKAKCA